MNLTSPSKKQEILESEISAMKRVVVASIIIEQAILLITDSAKHEFKQRCNHLISSARSIQGYFLNHRNTNGNYRETFRKEFLNGGIVLYGEILETIHSLDEPSLEHILSSLQNYVAQAEDEQESGESL